jgi:hypothetical protein
MKELLILYTPQCPSNLHFITKIKTWVQPYNINVKTVNVFENKDWKNFGSEHSEIGYTRHLFFKVFLEGRHIDPHPGDPKFKENLINALEKTR